MNNETKIWNFLKGKGLNDFAIAGVMGNLYAESGLIPNNLQNSYSASLGYTDEEYTKAVDDGSYTNFVRDAAGYGLAQWTYWSRKENLLNFAKAAGKSIGDLDMQLDFFWKELSGYGHVMSVLRTAKSVFEASTVVLLEYERPADQSEAAQKRRAGFGEKYYNQFTTTTTPEAEKAPETPKEEKPKGETIKEEVYVVKPGDTLSKIAKKYGTTYQNLAKYNEIANPNLIRVGQKVKIPGTGKSEVKPRVYTVRRGDTLGAIAKQYGTTYQKLAEYNGIANPNVIYVGQQIKIPN